MLMELMVKILSIILGAYISAKNFGESCGTGKDVKEDEKDKVSKF